MKEVVNAGFDGTFVDNNSLNCYCTHCQQKFHAYLSGRYAPSRIRERFGVDDASEISLGYRGSSIEWVKTDPDFLPFVEQTCSEEQLTSLFGTSNLDGVFIEEMGNFWLSTLAEQYRRDLEMRLTLRESAAKFGSDDVSSWGIRTPEERALWAETKRFRARCIADNQAMIKAIGRSIREDFCADVAVAYCYDELHMENVEHLRQVQKLTRYLCDQHILFDYVLENDLADAQLSRYRVVILPDVRYMNDAQMKGVERFVQAGGMVILTRETGRYDQDGKPRTPAGFAALLDDGVRDEKGVLAIERGGTCVHSFDLSNLLPQDRISRDDAFNGSVENVEVPGHREYYAMAQLDRDLGVDRYLAGGALLDYITSALGYRPCVADPIKGVGVRFNAYAKTSGASAKLVLHAVNYNLPLVGEVEEGGVIPVENLSVRIRVPNGGSDQGRASH